jgi:hypothetical protein
MEAAATPKGLGDDAGPEAEASPASGIRAAGLVPTRALEILVIGKLVNTV